MHLQHLIPWSDLVYCLRNDTSEILLPAGDCGKIHLIDKATLIKVSSRNFITDEDICTAKKCKTVDEPKAYAKKNRLTPPEIISEFPRRRAPEAHRKMTHFSKKLLNAFVEFAETEDKKYSNDVIEKFKPSEPAVIPSDQSCIECYGPCHRNCRTFLVWHLLTTNRIDHLLWLDKNGEVSLKEAFGRNYGGQAVGNGYNFLMHHHLLPFYIGINAILACGYENDEDKWGRFRSLLRNIQHDCDFLTFIPSLRHLLDKEILMKDLNKTQELLREVFRHLYQYVFLKKKLTSHFTYKSWEYEINSNLSYYFGFKYLKTFDE